MSHNFLKLWDAKASTNRVIPQGAAGIPLWCADRLRGGMRDGRLFVPDRLKVKHFKKFLRSVPLKCGITFRWEFLAVRGSSLFMWCSTSLCGDGFATQKLSKEGKEKASDCIHYTERPYGTNPTLLQKLHSSCK